MQDINLSQIRLKVNDTLKIYERIATKFEPINNKDVKKRYLDRKSAEVMDYTSQLEKKI